MEKIKTDITLNDGSAINVVINREKSNNERVWLDTYSGKYFYVLDLKRLSELISQLKTNADFLKLAGNKDAVIDSFYYKVGEATEYILGGLLFLKNGEAIKPVVMTYS